MDFVWSAAAGDGSSTFANSAHDGARHLQAIGRSSALVEGSICTAADCVIGIG
jgi:hypothetical protein